MMSSTKTLIPTLVASALLAGNLFAQDTYKSDSAHAHVGFSIAHMVISSVKGSFGEFEAELSVKDGKLLSAMADIQVASINTKNKKRDEHLKGADFFDAETFPKISFKSTGVTQKNGKDMLTGEMTIRDVTKAVELVYELKGPVKDPWGNTKVGLEASTTLNRQEFGLTWSKALESGGLVVGNDVTIEIDMEFAKQ